MARSGIGDRVEGIHAVRAALESGRVQKLIVERRRAEKSEDVAHLVSMARSRGLEVEGIDDVRPLSATSAPQGVVAKCRPMPDHDISELIDRSDPAAIVVIDHVEDTHNLGAIARSAVAAGITSLVVPTRRGAPLGGAAFKAAAGALEQCAVATVSSTADAVKKWRFEPGQKDVPSAFSALWDDWIRFDANEDNLLNKEEFLESQKHRDVQGDN